MKKNRNAIIEGSFYEDFTENHDYYDLFTINFTEDTTKIWSIEIPFKNVKIAEKLNKLIKCIKNNTNLNNPTVLYNHSSFEDTEFHTNTKISYTYINNTLVFIFTESREHYGYFPIAIQNLSIKITRWNKEKIIDSLNIGVNKILEFTEKNSESD